jgi:hypothetical protein
MLENISTQITKKYTEVKSLAVKEMNKYLTKKRKKQITTWFENGGKTTVFFGIIALMLVIIVSQFISLRKPQSTNQPASNQTTTKNESIPLNQAEYAGFKLDTTDTDFKVTVLEHSETIKKVEVANESVKMTITSTKIPDKTQSIQTGFIPENGQIIPPNDQTRLYEVKGKKIGIIPQVLYEKTSYILVNISKSSDGKDIYSNKFNLFGEQSKEYGYFDEVQIYNLHKDITQKDTESLDKALSILQNTESITTKEFFVDTTTGDDVKKLVDTKKYTESSKLKYKVALFDGYNLKDSSDINQFSIQKDDTGRLDVTKKEAQIPDTTKNLMQIGGTNMYRSSSLSTINDKNLIVPIYSTKGDYRTINLYPNNTQNIILASYTINLNQPVDDIKPRSKS